MLEIKAEPIYSTSSLRNLRMQNPKKSSEKQQITRPNSELHVKYRRTMQVKVILNEVIIVRYINYHLKWRKTRYETYNLRSIQLVHHCCHAIN